MFDAASLAVALEKTEQGAAWTVMALDYELAYLLEPAVAPHGGSPAVPDGKAARPLARFWRFAECEPLDAAAAEAFLAPFSDEPAGVAEVRAAWDETRYRAAAEEIQRLIAAGDCYQVNLTYPLDFSWFGSPHALYARLRARQPVRYGGFVGKAESGLVSLSPELFFSRQGNTLVTRPMKGTAPLEEAPEILAQSAKNRAENLMIVDLLRNDLGRVATTGSVRVDELFALETYPTVRQMVSQVSAEVPGRNFAALLKALFPCGSITGAPKIRAMQIINALEDQPRGVYTGALGWLSPDGDCRLNVAIRTLELEAGQRGKMGVGSGIVSDSEAAAEWAECALKAAFLRADPGLRLIETLRRENGVYPMWAGHLARLRRSAAALGFPLNEATAVQALAVQPMRGLWRVRLTLNHAGKVEVASGALDAAPPAEKLARLASETIIADDVLRRHKTTARTAYDAALAALPADGSVFDAVFLNERGEVAEGARSTVFVERGGVFLTPPLTSGALPGVLRAHLLASGKAREAVLWPTDLAEGFWLGNALRGLQRVRLEGLVQ
ncbi:MAG: aminodeoxychorismate synthase component I [Azonexus sp.]